MTMNFKIIDEDGNIAAKADSRTTADVICDAISRKWGQRFTVESYDDPIVDLYNALKDLQRMATERDLSKTDSLHFPIWNKVSEAIQKAERN